MNYEKYTVSNFLSALAKPSLFVYEAERFLSKIPFRLKYGTGTDIMTKDWDNLIILDACRMDYFAEYNDIDGELREIISKGSHSKEFINANFSGRTLYDTILVTANPFVEQLSNDVFFKVYYSELFDHWDDSLNTIPPEAVVDAAVKMHEQYPNKRLITHFMQPHVPFIGPTGRDLYDQFEFGTFNPALRESEDFDIPEVSLQRAVREGNIQIEELRQAYGENVQIAIRYAKNLIEQLEGKSVVTADHGELLGERVFVTRRYEHPAGLYVPELRIVPWLVVDSDYRREICQGEPSAFEKLEERTRESRLKALGYV